MLLQETYSTKEVETRWTREWGNRIIFAHGTNHSKGVMILFKIGIDFEVKSCYRDTNGRFIICVLTINDILYTISNIYAPDKEKEQVDFFNELKSAFVVQNMDVSDKLILGGDWNVIQNVQLDKLGGNDELKVRSLDMINNLKMQYDLQDIWRIFYPTNKRFTWRQKRPLIQCRLDFWLISVNIQDTVVSADIIPGVFSDHSAIILKLGNKTEMHRGNGFWKLNCSLLDNINYISEISELIPAWGKEHSSIQDKRILWDILKYEIRKFSIRYSSNKKRAIKSKENELLTKLSELELKLDQNPSPQLLTDYDNAKTAITELESYKTKGAIIRSKIQWVEEGEQSSQYFFGLEKNNYVKKHICKLERPDGTVTMDPEEILTLEQNYYKKLYSSKKLNNNPDKEKLFFEKNKTQKLTTHLQNICEGYLTSAECKKALNTFKDSKTPGNDGIPAEFYKKFWHLVGTYITDFLNFAFEHGELSTSHRQAVITLIEKKDKIRQKIQNWRPISLLNVDLKIGTKALALRLQDVLPYVIDDDQTGFVRGRTIFDSIKIIQDLMDLTKKFKLEGILLFIDFEKAFDSIEWSFLHKALEQMNFGNQFRKWIKTLYNNITSCIINNGATTPYFNLERGIRQGDPLSPYLFIICIEFLANKIRGCTEIKGFLLGKKHQKLCLYADDMTCTLAHKKSAERVFQIMRDFEIISGLKLNESKTQGLWLGKNRLNTSTPLGIEWPTTPVRGLGVYFTYDREKFIEYNFNDKLSKMKQHLDLWKMRKLSIFGKVLIVKTLGVSKFSFLATVVHIPTEIVKRVNNIIFEFIWGVRLIKLANIYQYKTIIEEVLKW